MKPRQYLIAPAMSALLLLAASANAGWGDLLDSARQVLDKSPATSSSAASTSLSTDEIFRGLKQALDVGAEKAIELLGQEGGFLNDASVRIPLPDTLERVAQAARAVGQGERVDQFTDSMNRAAEQAVPKTAAILSQAIEAMSMDDARAILQGSDSAATDYFRRSSSDPLRAAILPIVRQATASTDVTAYYKKLTGQGGMLGSLLNQDELDLDRYITDRTLDGLFLKLAEQERLIRKNPAARTTELLKSVFGGN